MLHAKAKEDPKRRFHALCDKVWREDFLKEAWVQVRRNGGTAGVDGERFKDKAYGVEGWLGELARDLREGTYVAKPVRQVLIPKKQPGKFRPLGIPCIRDRVAQTAALLVLEPILEADLQPGRGEVPTTRSNACMDSCEGVTRRWLTAQYGYRRTMHGLLRGGYQEVVDGDLSNYFGEIPHAELMKSREDAQAQRCRWRRTTRKDLSISDSFRRSRMIRSTSGRPDVAGISGRRGRLSTQPGERPKHLPQDQRVDGAEERDVLRGQMVEHLNPGGRTTLFWGEPGLPSDRPPRGPAAASVALSEAQGEDRGDGALLGRETMENLWTHLPGVKPQSLPWAKA